MQILRLFLAPLLLRISNNIVEFYNYRKKDYYKTEGEGGRRAFLTSDLFLFFFPLILNKAVCEFEPRENFIKIN